MCSLGMRYIRGCIRWVGDISRGHVISHVCMRHIIWAYDDVSHGHAIYHLGMQDIIRLCNITRSTDSSRQSRRTHVVRVGV